MPSSVGSGTKAGRLVLTGAPSINGTLTHPEVCIRAVLNAVCGRARISVAAESGSWIPYVGGGEFARVDGPVPVPITTDE